MHVPSPEFFRSLRLNTILTLYTHADSHAHALALSLGLYSQEHCGVPVDTPTAVARPLLPFRKRDLEDVCRENKLSVFEDPTNRTIK
jgi:hypothetical protein